MKRLIEQIELLANQHPELNSDLTFGPSSDVAIANVERQLRVRLPMSFKAYLLGFSGGMLLDYEICGIPNERAIVPGTSEGSNSLILDIIQANRELAGNFPDGHVYICGDGGDFSFFLDTNETDTNEECPVLMYGPGAEGKNVANSFLQFLSRIADRISFSD